MLYPPNSLAAGSSAYLRARRIAGNPAGEDELAIQKLSAKGYLLGPPDIIHCRTRAYRQRGAPWSHQMRTDHPAIRHARIGAPPRT